MKINLRLPIFLLLIGGLLFSCKTESPQSYDIVVYGGTSAGVMAAYTAKMKGKSVLLIEPGKHLGGLSSSGLGETDIGNKFTVSGLSRDFYRRLGKYYDSFEAWRFEPHKAEAVFNQYIAEAGVEVLYEYRIIEAENKAGKLQQITLESSADPKGAPHKKIAAKYFIDASYEGDLLGRAGVSYTLGREGNAKYGESLNGGLPIVKTNQVPDGIDPYVVPGDSSSGLLWGISSEAPTPPGQADKKVQAYNYRLCLTSEKSNQIPIARPADYDSTKYEILNRIIQQRADAGWTQRIHQLYLRVSPMPNFKTDINNKGGLSTDLIGGSWEYPEASYERRKELEQEHRSYIEGLLYFLAHDPRIPEHIKEQMREYGWPKDEFKDNGHFPHQIYVREARRLVGDFVMTEHHCRLTETIEDTIAMGAYNMDSHHGDRHVINGMVKNEGEAQEKVQPYAIAFRSMLPKQGECSNLLVAACLSASHIAYGSIRMEPVFMMLGQAAGVAAVEALQQGIAVQELDGIAIKELLKADPLVNGSMPEIELNNENASTEIIGDWTTSDKPYTDMYLTSFLVSRGQNAQPRKVVLHTQVPKAGSYGVYFYNTGEGRKDIVERAKAVPLHMQSISQRYSTSVDMSQQLESWIHLGDFELEKGAFSFEIDATGISEEVIADAVILQAR